MPNLPTNANLISGYSPYDGTLMVHEFAYDKYMLLDPQDLIIKYVSIPLYNIRMLPQFHQTRFNHPIAPLVDL